MSEHQFCMIMLMLSFVYMVAADSIVGVSAGFIFAIYWAVRDWRASVKRVR